MSARDVLRAKRRKLRDREFLDDLRVHREFVGLLEQIDAAGLSVDEAHYCPRIRSDGHLDLPGYGYTLPFEPGDDKP